LYHSLENSTTGIDIMIIMCIMAISVMDFSIEGYKTKKDFGLKSTVVK
jgi:hypothetical protein